MDIVDLEEKNRFFKKIKIKNKYFFKKKKLLNLMEDENFLNFCDEFFTNYYFDYSEYKNISYYNLIINLNYFDINIYLEDRDDFYNKIVINYIYFDKLYELNCLSLSEEFKLIKEKHNIINKNIYYYDKNWEFIKRNEYEFSLHVKLTYIKTLYENIVLLSLPFNDVNIDIVNKLKKEFFTFGVINYYEIYNEYIPFSDEGLYCGIKIIENELLLFATTIDKTQLRYYGIEINNIIYNFNFFYDIDIDVWDYKEYRVLVENFFKYKKFRLYKNINLNIFDFEFYFFYERNPFNTISLDIKKININLIFIINQNNIFINEDKNKFYFFKDN